MLTILYIVLGVAALFGGIAFIFSKSESPKDRAAEAAGAAAGGAIMAGSCLFQAAILAGVVLVGIWVLAKIFG